MKFSTPYSLYSTIDSSKRETSNVIILQHILQHIYKTNTFIYIAPKLWNSIHKRILKENGEILTTSVSLVKLRCKTIILIVFSSIILSSQFFWHQKIQNIRHNQRYSRIKNKCKHVKHNVFTTKSIKMALANLARAGSCSNPHYHGYY